MYQQPILCTVWCRFWYISFWQQWFIRSVKKAGRIIIYIRWRCNLLLLLRSAETGGIGNDGIYNRKIVEFDKYNFCGEDNNLIS